MLFFHRHPDVFSYILFYYIQGFLQRPSHIPSDLFVEECRFFSVPFECDEDENFILQYEDIRPNKRTFRPWFSVTGLMISLLSCLILFSEDISQNDFIYNHLMPNGQWIYSISLSSSVTIWIEMICTLWFMIELYVRYLYQSSSDQPNGDWELFIDLISISPVFFSLLTHTLSDWFPFLILLYPFHICLKSFRILRLFLYCPGLELIRRTLFLSLPHLSIAFILCALFLVPFGMIIYLLERNDPSSTIVDLFSGLHWAIETLTTTGFGEYIPHTYQGRCFSIFACLFGLIILALPIPIVFRRYQMIYLNALKADLWRTYRWTACSPF